MEWRTSKDYVGWAPIPPPNYTPPPGYKPEGYSPRKPVAEQLAPPAYLFASSDKFLQGLGQPYNPSILI
ncbi:MAG: hypothetical protein FJ134_00700 [Deltaproteobacteria bacterium]|nr:hypothetical protein [Deltaproteobacteria bacterium]